MAKRIVHKLINSQSKLDKNVLKTILKTSKVKEQIYMKNLLYKMNKHKI